MHSFSSYKHSYLPYGLGSLSQPRWNECFIVDLDGPHRIQKKQKKKQKTMQDTREKVNKNKIKK